MMQPPCILLTRDDDVARRIAGQLHSCAQVTRVAGGSDVLAECRRHDPLLLILEVGWREALQTCREVRTHYPDTLVIALGVMRSDPMIEAAALKVYACETAEVDRLRLQDLVRHAFSHLALLEENRILRDSASTPAVPAPALPLRAHKTDTKPLGPLTQVFGNFHDVEGMLRGVIETAASTAGVSRAGLFAQVRPGAPFSLRAGLRCLPDTHTLCVAPDDEFVRWMHEQAHVAARMTLPHIEPPATRGMIKRWLDLMGAEIVVPLHGHNRLIGWFFVGHLASGIPFDHDSLTHLIAVAQDVAVVLENGLLTEEAAVQKTLAETVLGSIPAGIVAIDSGGCIQWFNTSAGRMLGIDPGDVIGQPP